MSTGDLLRQRMQGTQAAMTALQDRLADVEAICTVVADALDEGGTLYTAGNGGSAAQALHLAEELIGRYRGNRRAYPAVCLAADSTALTCIANDFGYDQVFARQLEGLIGEQDVFVALSTSGNSPNLVTALDAARGAGATTIGLLGKDGGACRDRCDHAVVIPMDDSAHIQEAHLVVIHLICEVVEGVA